MKTKNLTRQEACQAAQAAAVVTGKRHIALQRHNGRWKWMREGFLNVRAFCLRPPRCWYIYDKRGLHGGGGYAKVA